VPAATPSMVRRFLTQVYLLVSERAVDMEPIMELSSSTALGLTEFSEPHGLNLHAALRI
jgi:hypothetical protein